MIKSASHVPIMFRNLLLKVPEVSQEHAQGHVSEIDLWFLNSVT